MLRQSVRVALVVGTILIAINHGDAVLHGEWSRALAWKIPLTYLVPFSVATYAALANIRRGAVAVAASIHISPDPLRRRRISIP
jgi:hypothetical protein